MSNVRASWFNYAMTAPADREAFDLLAALLHVTTVKPLTLHEVAPAVGAAMDRLEVRQAFLDEAEELGLEVRRFEYLRGRVTKARLAYLDAGGTFGGFHEGVFHEPTHPMVSDPRTMKVDVVGGNVVLTTEKMMDTSFMEDVIDRQTLFRLHVLSMLEAREAAREAKAAKDAAKAAEKAAKAAAKEAARLAAETANP